MNNEQLAKELHNNSYLQVKVKEQTRNLRIPYHSWRTSRSYQTDKAVQNLARFSPIRSDSGPDLGRIALAPALHSAQGLGLVQFYKMAQT